MADSEIKQELTQGEKEITLRVYELAQQSAEHHDTLLWEVTYIIWGSTTLLLGFVLEAIKQEPFLALMTALLSIFLSVMVLRFAMLYRQVRNTKYTICKEIEDALEMKTTWKQHTVTKDYGPGVQTKWYWFATGVFIFMWVCVAVRSSCLFYLYHCR
ncbi:MAG TPA: hypothetical protein VKI40_05015 [Terriglobales bacterium]|nr:hypothetical protein [Terriglobales bacterium]